MDDKSGEYDSDRKNDEMMKSWGDGWTCQQCRDGSIGFGNLVSEEDKIQEQTEKIIDSGICSDDVNEAWCKQRFRGFWSFWGTIFWRTTFSGMCKDKEAECGPGPMNTYGNMTVTLHRRLVRWLKFYAPRCLMIQLGQIARR